MKTKFRGILLRRIDATVNPVEPNKVFRVKINANIPKSHKMNENGLS